MATFTERRDQMFAPDPARRAAGPERQLDQRFLATLVGLAGLTLPAVLAASRLVGECDYDAASHYYHSPSLGGFFVACLAAIGTFLVGWRGDNKVEGRLASVAGVGAFLVAIFPTSGSGCDAPAFVARPRLAFVRDPAGLRVAWGELVPDKLDEELVFGLSGWSDTLHFLSAAVVFACLALLCLLAFTRVVDDVDRLPDGTLRPEKAWRNRFYVATGWTIVACLLLLGAYGGWEARFGRIEPLAAVNVTFWLEAVMLVAFALSWLVKGRLFGRWKRLDG